jgi:hypothetical protein
MKMSTAATRLLRPYRATAAIALALSVAHSLPQAQSATKQALSVEDYTKWRTIAGQLSGDGKWGRIRPSADQHGADGRETGAALEEPRLQ